MARQVLVNVDNLTLPDGGTYNTDDVVVLTDEQFAEIAATALGDEVTDQGAVAGPGDSVAANVAALAGGADLPTTVTKVNEILTALKADGLMEADA